MRIIKFWIWVSLGFGFGFGSLVQIEIPNPSFFGSNVCYLLRLSLTITKMTQSRMTYSMTCQFSYCKIQYKYLSVSTHINPYSKNLSFLRIALEIDSSFVFTVKKKVS